MFESMKSSNEDIKIISDENYKKNRIQNKRHNTKYSHKNKTKLEFPPKRTSSKKLTKATLIVKETEGVDFINMENNPKIKKGKRRSFKLKSKIENNKIIGHQVQNLKTSGDKINEGKVKEGDENDIKKKQSKLDNFELNNLEYDEACELDKRGFCSTYISVLMREHLLSFRIKIIIYFM